MIRRAALLLAVLGASACSSSIHMYGLDDAGRPQAVVRWADLGGPTPIRLAELAPMPVTRIWGPQRLDLSISGVFTRHLDGTHADQLFLYFQVPSTEPTSLPDGVTLTLQVMGHDTVTITIPEGYATAGTRPEPGGPVDFLLVPVTPADFVAIASAQGLVGRLGEFLSFSVDRAPLKSLGFLLESLPDDVDFTTRSAPKARSIAEEVDDGTL